MTNTTARGSVNVEVQPYVTHARGAVNLSVKGPTTHARGAVTLTLDNTTRARGTVAAQVSGPASTARGGVVAEVRPYAGTGIKRSRHRGGDFRRGQHSPTTADLRPFAADSVWRLTTGATATFAAADDPRNVTMGQVDAAGQAWANWSSFSHPVNYAYDGDPYVDMVDTLHNPTSIPVGGTFVEQIPVNARIAAGTDEHMHVIATDRQHILEHFRVVRQTDGSYTCRRRHSVDLNGSGVGPQNGTRAYGGSAIGGLVRAFETRTTHIQHALAMALRKPQMLYTGTDAQDGHGGAYNGAGYGLSRGYVWPATEQDSNANTTYTGTIPMGSYFAIPPGVDLTTLGLTTDAAMTVARACQEYGVYVTDTSGSSCFYVEDDGDPITGAWVTSLLGPFKSGGQLRTIVKALRLVTNNSPATPNGHT